MRIQILCTFLLVIAVGGGCQPSTESVATSQPSHNEQPAEGQPEIAVVDVNEVARRIGAMETIRQSMSELEEELRANLSDFKKQLDSEYQAEADQYTEDMNEQVQGELDSMLSKHQRALNQETVKAQNQLAAHHNHLKIKLMNDVRPVAYEVAQQQGMSIVLTTSQVYAAGQTSDITDAVAERILEMNEANSDRETTATAARKANLPGGGDFKPF